MVENPQDAFAALFDQAVIQELKPYQSEKPDRPVRRDQKMGIYLDNAATTRASDKVVTEIAKYLRKTYGNPGSSHALGEEAREAINQARERIADLIGASADEIIFTSGGSEANNLAILGYVQKEKESHALSHKTGGKGHIITSAIEHSAVLNPCRQLEKEGYRVTYLPVDRNGLVSAADVETAIESDTILITIMTANNEVGSVQPIAEIGKIAKNHDIFFHTDAVQACGHIPIDVNELGVDMLSMSAHKINGPKGVGFLYVRDLLPYYPKISPIIYGGGQERGFRSSTENVPGIMGMALAFEDKVKNLAVNTRKYEKLQQRFLSLVSESGNVILNGDLGNIMPHFLNVQVLGSNNKYAIPHFSRNGLYVSGTSACNSRKTKSSHVLLAMGLSRSKADSSLRITMGPDTTKKEIDTAARMILSYTRR